MKFCIVQLAKYVEYEEEWKVFEKNRSEKNLRILITKVEEKIKTMLEDEFSKGGYTIKVIPKQNFKWYDINVTKKGFQANYVSTLQFEVIVYDILGQVARFPSIPFKTKSITTFCGIYLNQFIKQNNKRGIILLNFISKLT